MNNNLQDGNAEHENSEASSSSIPSDEIRSIIIIFPSPRYAMQPVSVQALMNKSEKVSRLSYNLAAKIRNTRDVLIEMDLGTAILRWRAVASILWHKSTFEVVKNMEVDVILGEEDCKQLEQERNMLWVGDSINSYFCDTSAAERKRQDEKAAALKLENNEGMAEALRIMHERDRKKREETLLKARSSQGQGSDGQQGSSQNS